VIRAQLYRAWPWLSLLAAVVLAACNNGSGGNTGPGY
jgi:predicted small secreted protein